MARGGGKEALAEYRRKRDFRRTAEPAGGDTAEPPEGALRFVIQKHAASHLHFDLRLELDGVMKSWAVPKGPSVDPSVKRLAMEVEDHPIEYNTFEGTIPKGQYGGGTVMLWDRGHYTADPPDEDDASGLRSGFRRGDMKFILHGKRLQGSFVLVRTKSGDPEKPQWLLMKHRDEHAAPGTDIVAEVMTSVESGRTMEEIARDADATWEAGGAAAERSVARKATRKASKSPARSAEKTASDKASKKVSKKSARAAGRADPAVVMPDLSPMLASLGTEVPNSDGWTFEPKYDGIRVLAFATRDAAQLITRNARDKCRQFPEIVESLKTLVRKARRPVVLDGEIVALGEDDAPARFQAIQARMHVTDESSIESHVRDTPAAFIAFDQLLDGDAVLIGEPWSERRARLERTLRNRTSPRLRLGETIPGDGQAMLDRARADGWEGIIAKRTGARYAPGARSRDWLKLKVELRQELVVGGWTEPRNSREHIGALLLGYYDGDRFVYVGHTGGGFTRAGLRDMYALLAPLARKSAPFDRVPKTNERAHWTEPRVVVEVKFSEWTSDGKLRQPIYLGTRDDKDARDVALEPPSVQPGAASSDEVRGATAARAAAESSAGAARKKTAAKKIAGKKTVVKKTAVRKTAANKTAARKGNSTNVRAVGPAGRAEPALDRVLDQLFEIESGGGSGTVSLPGGARLEVSSLDKVFWPKPRHTKGDLMRFYTQVARFVLPVMRDRALVLKRYPNGVEGSSFFQQNAPDNSPEGVRVEMVYSNSGEEQPRIIGGDLQTLLYTVQLGNISLDPWHSRIQHTEFADYSIIDLDPGTATFAGAQDVARWVHDELAAVGLGAVLKTSGKSGLHIAVPLPPKTPNDAGTLVAQIIATRVAEKHQRHATVERSVKARPKGAVYVDYLQNIRGKTVAGAYAVRATPEATVSTPLGWNELETKLDPRDFTIDTVPDRLRQVGDIWATGLRARNSLRKLLPQQD